MGRAKDALMEEEGAREQKWADLAIDNEWVCSICGEYIRLEDETIYYQTGMCGLHAYMMDKDD